VTTDIGALVIVGSSRHGKAGQTLLGNVAVALMHGSPCAVAVAPSGCRDDLARAYDAPLRLIAVADPPPIVVGRSGGAIGGWHALKEELEAEARAQLEAARSSAPDDVSVEATLITGEAAAALADRHRLRSSSKDAGRSEVRARPRRERPGRLSGRRSPARRIPYGPNELSAGRLLLHIAPGARLEGLAHEGAVFLHREYHDRRAR
jgi:nucleotide-binding universal stress UspA family protein